MKVTTVKGLLEYWAVFEGETDVMIFVEAAGLILPEMPICLVAGECALYRFEIVDPS